MAFAVRWGNIKTPPTTLLAKFSPPTTGLRAVANSSDELRVVFTVDWN